MSLRIGSALKRAGHQTASRAGVQLMVLYAIYALVYQTGANGLLATGIRAMGLPAEAAPPTFLDVPLVVHAGLTFIGLVLGLYFTLVSLRTLVDRERHGIPQWAFTRRPGWGMANVLVAGILFTIVLAIGFVLLVVPGIIAYIAFIFTVVFVADEDLDALTAFRRSWNLSRGNWLRIGFVLLIVFGIATALAMVVSMATAFGAGALGIGPGVIGVGTLVLFSPVYIYVLAVLTEMYNQLRAEESTDDMVEL